MKKMMELTNSEIEFVINEIKDIRNKGIKLDGYVMYFILKNLKLLEEVIKPYATIKNDLIIKYGENDGLGGMLLNSDMENWSKYLDEIEPMAKDLTEINFFVIEPDKLKGSEITMDNIIALDYMIEE